jgi:hypothetical protein
MCSEPVSSRSRQCSAEGHSHSHHVDPFPFHIGLHVNFEDITNRKKDVSNVASDQPGNLPLSRRLCLTLHRMIPPIPTYALDKLRDPCGLPHLLTNSLHPQALHPPGQSWLTCHGTTSFFPVASWCPTVPLLIQQMPACVLCARYHEQAWSLIPYPGNFYFPGGGGQTISSCPQAQHRSPS